MSLVDDPSLVDTTPKPNGQQTSYLVLSAEDRAKGLKRPLRSSYTHTKCGTSTRMNIRIAQTYAVDPDFYTGTFCVACGQHFSFKNPDGDENADGVFHWDHVPEGDPTRQLGFEVFK